MLDFRQILHGRPMKPDFDPSRPAVPIAYPRLLVEILNDWGTDRETLRAGTGISPGIFESPENRLTPAQFLHLVLNAFYYGKNPALGYELGLRTPVTSHGFLGYGVMSCQTLRDAIELASKYVRLRTILMTFRLYEDGDEAVVEANANYPVGPLRQFVFESLLLSLARAGTFISGTHLQNGEIHFDYPEPDYYAANKHRLPPMKFNRSANQLRFPRALLDQPLVMADPVAARLAVEQCEREMALLNESAGDLPGRLRALFGATDGVYPNLDTAAEKLFMSTRTLKRRLQQHGTTFQALLDESRRRDAMRLLANSGLSVEQVATRLGYSDPANFTRAFRKWSGVTPRQYREQSRQQAADA